MTDRLTAHYVWCYRQFWVSKKEFIKREKQTVCPSHEDWPDPWGEGGSVGSAWPGFLCRPLIYVPKTRETKLSIRACEYWDEIAYPKVWGNKGRRHDTKKSCCSFGFCPNYLLPPPQFGQLVQLFLNAKIVDLSDIKKWLFIKSSS